MKRIISGGSALAAATALAVPAFAADAPIYSEPPAVVAPAPAPVAQVYDWTGFYVGGHAGYFWGDADADFSAPPSSPFSVDVDGFLGGLQAGANWQIDQFVVGVEGDFSWSGADGSTDVLAPAVASADLNWLSTVRGRVGMAFDRFLVYGTGGIAFADVDGTIDDGFGTVASAGRSHTGWTIGAGLEAAITENLSAKAEYLYVDLGDKNYDFAGTGVDADLSGSYVRAGLNYRFNLY